MNEQLYRVCWRDYLPFGYAPIEGMGSIDLTYPTAMAVINEWKEAWKLLGFADYWLMPVDDKEAER